MTYLRSIAVAHLLTTDAACRTSAIAYVAVLKHEGVGEAENTTCNICDNTCMSISDAPRTSTMVGMSRLAPVEQHVGMLGCPTDSCSLPHPVIIVVQPLLSQCRLALCCVMAAVHAAMVLAYSNQAVKGVRLLLCCCFRCKLCLSPLLAHCSCACPAAVVGEVQLLCHHHRGLVLQACSIMTTHHGWHPKRNKQEPFRVQLPNQTR